MRRVGAAFTAAGGPPAQILPSLGTTGGLRALGSGAVDLAVASRPAKPDEASAGIVTTHVASTPLGFVTRQAEPARALSRQELASMFTGTLANWPDGTALRFVRRQPSDSDWDLFGTLSPGIASAVAHARVRPGVPTFLNDQEQADALERMPGSIGGLALGQVAAEGRRLRPVALDGVLPTVAMMESGDWPLATQIFIAHARSPRPGVLAFTAFLKGPDAAAILAELAYLPIGAPQPSRQANVSPSLALPLTGMSRREETAS